MVTRLLNCQFYLKILGGDQFLDVQKSGLNKFYNYFYWAINAGALISNFVVPMIQAR